jgi:C-terminal processing protease CtpA/Prc
MSTDMIILRRDWRQFSIAVASVVIWGTAVAGGVREAPGYLGFLYTLQDDPPPSTRQWLHVRSVLPGGPAQTAGVKPQDIVIAIDGKPVQFKTKRALIDLFASIRPQAVVRLTIVRASKQLVIPVRAAKMSAEDAQRWQKNYELAKELDSQQP